MKFDEYIDTTKKPAITEAPVKTDKPHPTPRWMKTVDAIVKEVSPSIGKDIEKAASFVYQILEDVNAHSENRKFEEFLKSKYKMSFGDEYEKDAEGRKDFKKPLPSEHKNIYQAWKAPEGKSMGDYGHQIDWGIEPAFEIAKKIMKSVGVNTKDIFVLKA